jgi:uncharacterized phage protein (TIGR02218 family)
MKTATPALVSLINSGTDPLHPDFVYCHLYTITLFSSQGAIYLTDGPIDVAWNGNVFSSKTVRIDSKNSKATAHWKRGLDLDNWTVVFAPRNVDPVTGAAYPDLIGSVPWIAAARAGALEGADVQVDRAFFAKWPQPYTNQVVPVGTITIFAGQPAEVDTTDTLVCVVLEDYRALLAKKYPKDVFSLGCRHTLYDAGCTLNPASFAVAGTCVGGTTRQQLACNPITPGGSGTFTLGKVLMTSGLNAGFSRMVRQWTAPGLLALFRPLPFDVLAGDTFTAYPGCDKQQGTCTAFGNLANFGGQSFIPDATTAV